jgi:hypothetical protein
MKLTLEPTGNIENVDGMPCRIWEGVTDTGTPVKAWIRTVQPQTHDEAALAVFEAELQRLPQPVTTVIAIDRRFVT